MARLQDEQEKLLRANQSLEHLAVTDPLTSLINRRQFERVLKHEWRRSTRASKAISVLMIDTDYFKNYNDRYGHLEGDACLKRIADAIASVPRRTGDLVARYGGEEFVVLLPNTDQAGAEIVSDQIREAVNALAMEHGGSPHRIVTVSIGYSTLQSNEELHPAMLLHTADLALYRAKRDGRNCSRTLGVVEIQAEDL